MKKIIIVFFNTHTSVLWSLVLVRVEQPTLELTMALTTLAYFPTPL